MILYAGLVVWTVLLFYVFCRPYRKNPVLFMLLLVLCVFGPGCLYLQLGSPHLADHPFSTHQQGGDLERDVANLSHRIAGFPTDQELWRELGKGLTDLGYYREAAKALEHAQALAKSLDQKNPKNLIK